MREEIIMGLILGFLTGTPFGWFLKSAFTWRRDARRLSGSEPKVAMPVEPAAPAPGSRLESLLERVNQRLETVEDRLEFTERLLDARTPPRGQPARRLNPADAETESPGDRRG